MLAAVVVALGGAAVVDHVRSTTAADRLRDATGGVLSLTDPPQVVLRIPLDTKGVDDDFFWLTPGPGDTAVVRDDHTVAVVSLSDGSYRAVAQEVSNAMCAKDGKTVICTTHDDAPRAFVIAADGAITVDKTLPGTGWASPGTDGHVALVTANDAGSEVSVAWLNLASGAATWERTITMPQITAAARSDSGEMFKTMTDDTVWCPAHGASVPQAIAGVWGTTLVIDACPVSITYDTTTGELVSGPVADGIYSSRDSRNNALYRYLISSDRAHHQGLDPTGQLAGIQGEALRAIAVDGREWDGSLIAEDAKITAYDRHGHRMWAHKESRPRHVAAVGDSLIYATSTNDLVAVRALSGHQLWSSPLKGIRTEMITDAFTDSHVVVLVSTRQLMAYDVGTGKLVWDYTVPEPINSLNAVGGRLVGLTTDNELLVFQ